VGVVMRRRTSSPTGMRWWSYRISRGGVDSETRRLWKVGHEPKMKKITEKEFRV